MRYLILVAFLLASCASTRVGDSDIISGNSRAAGQLEATVEALDRTTASSRERIGAVIDASRSIEEGIGRLEFLFRCYEREVDELQRSIDSIRREAESSD